MQSTAFVIVLIGLLGGMAIGIQSPLASMLNQRLGALESVFIIHAGGAIFSILPLLIYGNRLAEWRGVPWYALGAGAFGLVVVSAFGYMIPRVGLASSLTLVIAGQLLIGAFLDHYGFLGMEQRPLEWSRIFGFMVVMAGVWLTVK